MVPLPWFLSDCDEFDGSGWFLTCPYLSCCDLTLFIIDRDSLTWPDPLTR